MQRRLSAAIAATIVALAAFVPTTFAECMTWPLEATEQPRVAFAFVATVTDVEQQEQFEEGSGQFRYEVTLDTERVYRGRVQDEFDLTGTNAGCSFLYEDALAVGDRLFIVSERLSPSQYETDVGNVLVWRQLGSTWTFYEAALSYGSDEAYYWPAARAATTTASILRLVSEAPLPDTATASVQEGRTRGGSGGATLLLLAGLTGAIGAIYLRRRPMRG